jgi:hypothetical protein
MYVGTYSALAAALFLLFYLTGHAATRRLVPLPLGAAPEEKAALRLVVGVAVWATLLFALAALQRLRPAPVAAVTAAAAVWGLWSVWKGRARPAEARAPGRSIVQRDPLAILLLAVVAVALAALWAQTLRPIVAWDADVYHLTVPRLYLEHGGFRRIPFNVYSNWPLAIQLLFALAMVVEDYVLASALHFGFGVVLIGLLGMAAARATTPLWGAIAAASLLLHQVFLFEIRVAYVDVACAFLLFTAFLALHRALDDAGEEHRRWLVLSGVACGVLAAAKLNGVFGALCIATAYVVSRLRGGTPPRAMVKPLLAFTAPVIVLVSPWIAKSLVLTGNPVYPLLYDVFGGPEWSSALGAAHQSWQRAIGMGRSPLDLLLLPARVLFLGGEGYEHFDGRLHPLLGVLLPIALFGLRDKAAARALGVAATWFVLWAATSQQMRFLIPVLPLVSLATVAGLHRLSERWLPRPKLLADALALILTVLVVQANLRYLDQALPLYAAYWTHSDELRAHATDDVFGVIDQRLPADAKLLFVNINRGFFCRREYFADSFFEASQTGAMLHDLSQRVGVRQGLRDLGITHVLIDKQPRGIDYPREFVELLANPANRLVYQSPDGRFALIALARG